MVLVAANGLVQATGPAGQEGCCYENGLVRIPRGFKVACHTFHAGGWTGIAVSE
jgi:hypothetical protein